MTVLAPLMPGHGTTWQDLSTRTWQEWARAAESGLATLRSRCQTVFLGGLSMGSLLTLYLAAHHPELAGAIVYSPAVIVRNRLIWLTPVARYFLKTLRNSTKTDLVDPDAPGRTWSYEYYVVPAVYQVLRLQLEVRRLLPTLRVPLLIVYSPRDQMIHPSSAAYTYARAGSQDKQMMALERSGHALTVDVEWEQVAERTYKFILEHEK
jgi:carboxylesterase